VVEPHGLFDPNLELTKGATPQTKRIQVIFQDDTYTAVEVQLAHTNIIFITLNKDFNESKQHTLTIANTTYNWTGNYHIANN
jgi:hypothetical protein